MRIKIKAYTAQQDNNYNLGGDAGRAKELLDQASSEVKQDAKPPTVASSLVT